LVEDIIRRSNGTIPRDDAPATPAMWEACSEYC
jgi:hypothetical protein